MAANGKFKNSWLIFKNSLAIMRKNKKLMVFPFVTFILTIFIILFFFAPVVLRPTGYSYIQIEHWKAVGTSVFTQQSIDKLTEHKRGNSDLVTTRFGMYYFIMIYFVSMFLATFFNVAFYNEIFNAIKGKPVSITGGIKFASTKLKAIFLWSLLAGIVGMIIQKLEQQFNLVGKIIIRLIGISWSVASIFVIPVIIREEHSSNPILMLKKSSETIKKTWGESLIGFAGFNFVGLFILLYVLLFFIASVFLSIKLNNFLIIGIAAIFSCIFLSLFIYISNVAGQIYQCVLYVFASEGAISDKYSREMFDMAWKAKK